MSRASGFFESRFPLVRTQQTNRDERNLKLFTGHHGTIAGLRFGARDGSVDSWRHTIISAAAGQVLYANGAD
jgi:hypothetical protein